MIGFVYLFFSFCSCCSVSFLFQREREFSIYMHRRKELTSSLHPKYYIPFFLCGACERFFFFFTCKCVYPPFHRRKRRWCLIFLLLFSLFIPLDRMYGGLSNALLSLLLCGQMKCTSRCGSLDEKEPPGAASSLLSFAMGWCHLFCHLEKKKGMEKTRNFRVWTLTVFDELGESRRWRGHAVRLLDSELQGWD